MPRLQRLTVLRFVAALGVVLAHAVPDLVGLGTAEDFSHYGGLGVDFFFVLSGFVLAWSWDPGRTAARFYWLRFARVWPTHALMLVIVLLFGLAHVSDPGLLPNVLLVQSWSWDPFVYLSFNAPSWTLSCEAFFYACFPFVVRRLAGRGVRTLVLVVLVACAGVLVVPVIVHVTPALLPHEPWADLILPVSRLPQFVAGVAAAFLVKSGRVPRVPVWPAAVALLAVPGAAGAFSAAGHEAPSIVFTVLMTPVCVLVVVLVAASELRTQRTTPRLWVACGEWSFALYLVHLPLLHLVERWLPVEDAGWAVLVAFVLVAVGCSALVHLGFEAPVERRLRALAVGGRRPRVTSPPLPRASGRSR